MDAEYFDEPSRLAAETRRALAQYLALDRAGHPVLTSDRDAARDAIDAARAAEAAYWSLRGGEVSP